MIEITKQNWQEQFGMVRRLIEKAEDPWRQGVQLVRRQGYQLSFSWARPEISGRHYRVRLSCDYPDATGVIASLYPIDSTRVIEEKPLNGLLEGFIQATKWLNELEKNQKSSTVLRWTTRRKG
ncbi:MAG: hypothetical protein H0Z33_06970 [Bacillaceae bacterium]|nr:hypothetical protein [Bacillaceae bacterium]